MRMGEKIVLERKKFGLSQEELAVKLEISRQAVSRWETNEAIPNTEKVIQLSKLFHVSTDYLLLDDYEKNENNINDAKGNYENHDDTIRHRKKIVTGAVNLSAGALLVVVALITAWSWAEQGNAFYAFLGKFGTGLLTTWSVIPFVLGVIFLVIGGTILSNEYIHGKK